MFSDTSVDMLGEKAMHVKTSIIANWEETFSKSLTKGGGDFDQVQADSGQIRVRLELSLLSRKEQEDMGHQRKSVNNQYSYISGC